MFMTSRSILLNHHSLWSVKSPVVCWWKSLSTSMDLCFKSHLIGGFNTSEKYESQLGCLYIIPNIWKKKKCSKPPTSHVHHHFSSWTYHESWTFHFDYINLCQYLYYIRMVNAYQESCLWTAWCWWSCTGGLCAFIVFRSIRWICPGLEDQIWRKQMVSIK